MPKIIVLAPFKFAHLGYQVEAFEPHPEGESRDTTQEVIDVLKAEGLFEVCDDDGRCAAERLAAEKAEAERLAAEKAEAERLAAEKAEADRQAEADRLPAAGAPVASKKAGKA